MMLALDRSMRHKDVDGRLHVEKTIVSIANVCPYYGREITNWEALGLDPARIYNLYRDAKELQKAANLYHNIPLLEKHVAISAQLPAKELWVGTVSDGAFENPNLYASLAVWDQKGIDLIESSEKEQLSAGYYFQAIMTPGTAPDGTRFDGRMVDLIPNHVALVKEGRVGPDSTIADESLKKVKPMPSKYAALAKLLPDTVDVVAFDAAMDAEVKKAEDAAREEAHDADCDYYGKAKDEWEKMSAEDRKAARDEWEDEEEKKKKAGDKKGGGKDGKPRGDADPDHRKDFEGLKDSMISKDELPTILKAHGDAVRKQVADAFEAREAVRPVCGAVALDSADEIYAFALKRMGVKIDGVPAGAYRTIFEVANAKKPTKPVPAFDAAAASSVEAIFHHKAA